MFDEITGCLGAFLRALESEFHLPLHGRMRDFARRHGRKQAAAMLVAAGFLTGLAIAAVSGIVMWIFNRFAGAMVFALLYTLFLLFHDRGRGDGLLAAKAARYLPDEYIPVNIIVPILLMVIKFALLLMLFYHGGAVYGALIAAAGFSLEMLIVTDSGFSSPSMERSSGARKRIMIAALAALLITFFTAKAAAAGGALIFALLWRYAEKRLADRGMTAGDIRQLSALCIWLMLIAGVLMI